VEEEGMLQQVVIIRAAFDAALRELVRNPRAFAWGRAAMNRVADRYELLCHHLTVGVHPDISNSESAVLLWVGNEEAFWQRYHQEVLRQWRQRWSGLAPVALITLDRAPQRGTFRALWLSDLTTRLPVHHLTIVGPGMRRIMFIPRSTDAHPSQLSTGDRERWSRVIGALDEESWLRLRALRFALVGLGRSGSVFALSLARLGLTQLTLIDPDRIERHNIDSMDGVTEADLGRFKVEAVRDAIITILGDIAAVITVPESISSFSALAEAKQADIVISCVDHDGARLAAALLATFYCKPFLDVGTGIVGAGAQRDMGADIRLILPGERCLWCYGGVARREQVRTFFATEGTPPEPTRPWQAERAGSLRSLNAIAVHYGLRLVEDLIQERLQHSLWVHLEFDTRGQPSVSIIDPPILTNCPVCSYTAVGDAGLQSLPELRERFRDQ
jgi:molybdopterin/thiamine biosynthesis adenylyltransferase